LPILKLNRDDVAPKALPSRSFRELVSHNALHSHGIAIRVVEVFPSSQVGPRHAHSHPDMEEVIYVESGAGIAWVEGETTSIGAGDTILIPAGKRHMMINSGIDGLKLFCAFSAADPENHYQEHSEFSYPESSQA
jgi:quercetin dioxygenase-like cupin family protein